MPIYEYVCTECRERTEVKASISEKEKELKLACPKCASHKMAQVFGNFGVIGSSKDMSTPHLCEPQAGPGCCS